MGQTVIIQHDGATPHVGHDNEAIMTAAGSTQGWRFQEATGPISGPKHLRSWFLLLPKSTHRGDHANNIPQIIEKVREALGDSYDAHTLDNIWGHLFARLS